MISKSGLCEAHIHGASTSTFHSRDRYHATAIEKGEHFLRCVVYIDLNMVRTGMMAHPQQWPHGGYREIQSPRRRFVLIDYDRLARMSGYDEFPRFQTAHREWVEKALAEKERRREAVWSESVAVGSRDYVAQVGAALGGMGCGRRIRKVAEGWELREAQAPYNADSEEQNGVIGHLNQRVWRINETITKI